jgi:hypothetical protein
MKALAAGMLASLLLGTPWQDVRAQSAASDPAVALIDAIAARQDPRIAASLARIAGTNRRLLALRGYLRAGAGIVERWSWSEAQIADFAQSPEYRAMQVVISGVRQAFVAANPGFDLWVNPDVRSLDTQLRNWNRSASVASAAAALLDALHAWQESAAFKALPPAARRRATENFLVAFVPVPTPTLAVPGLSPHGQMRAIDFHIRKGGRTVAGPGSAADDWHATGWAQRLQSAVRAGSERLEGPLQLPQEPWHYTYSPTRTP